MEVAIIVTALVIVAAVLAIAGYFSHKAELRRTEQFGQLASEMGFEFDPVATSAASAAFAGLPLFSKGHSKKSKNLLRKSVRELNVAMFDYQYTVGSGKHRQTHKLTVSVFTSPNGLAAADFDLNPRSFWHSIGAMFGYRGIAFESHPGFASKYMLRGTFESAVRAAFSPQVLEFFENHPALWSVESRGNRLVVHRRARIKPEESKQFVADTTRISLLLAPNQSE